MCIRDGFGIRNFNNILSEYFPVPQLLAEIDCSNAPK